MIRPAAACAVFAASALVGPSISRADEVPIAATVTVDAADLALTGHFTLNFEFTPAEPTQKAYAVQVLVAVGSRTLLTLTHAPPSPTTTWKKDAPVRYDIDVPFPFDADLRGAESVEIWLGFIDSATGECRPPSNGSSASARHAMVDRLEVPKPSNDADASLAAADAMVKAGKKDEAWNVLDLGLRQALSDPVKYRFRDAMVKLGALAPPPLSIEEEAIVADRIEDEKRRVLREAAGRFHDQKHYPAALRILEAIGGKLTEQGQKAVLGALNEAKRTEQDATDIREKLVEVVSPEETAEAEAAIKSAGLTRDLLKRVDEWVKARKYAVARFALNKLYRGTEGAVSTEAYGRLKEVEKEWCAFTPAAEQALVDGALNHPSFARTRWVASRQFIFIGPKTLVEGIPALSKMRFDLAYVFLTDLFGRRPNPGGDRVTVYFKELFDFGGGIGGGKIIDIGKADANAKETRVDNGLLYHELTHCIDDTSPICQGFREGLANFGAAYTFEVLGQGEDLIHAFQSNLDAFRRDYLARDLEWWRIQNYGPSAGFFLHFVDKYAKTRTGHDWAGMRRFFRAYRMAPVKDGREPFLVRPFAKCLVEAFGPAAFDDLITFRFPLVTADREVLDREWTAFDGGEGDVLLEGARLAEAPNSPLTRDLVAHRFMEKVSEENDPDGVRRIGREELGIVYDWRGIGPFELKGASPGSHPFPPEYEIEFAKDYPGRGNICKWTEARSDGSVKIDATGWVTFDFSYQDDTASYALSHATVTADTDAWAYFRADDDLTLFVNGELAGSYEGRGIETTVVPWRGPIARVPDQMRFPVALKKGRNRILVKVRNRGGPSGFVLALCRRDNNPIEGLATDRETPSPPVFRRPPPPEDHWKTVAKGDFAKGAKVLVAAGRFDLQNKLLVGTATDKSVGWRTYTVRPGFPKDAPSNLAWLPPKATEGLDAFRLTLVVATARKQAPKMTVTFQGEGETDGLSGWTLILRPAGDGRAQASLERYDREVYESAPMEFAWAETLELAVLCEGRRVSVRLANLPLLGDVPIDPIPGKHRIGFATWGPEVKLASFDLEGARK